MGLFPRQKHRPNHIKVSLERDVSRVVSQLHEDWEHENVSSFDVPLGKKPSGISSAVYLEQVGVRAHQMLMNLRLGNICIGSYVTFNQSESAIESKRVQEYSGYGNKPAAIFDPNHLHIVFDRITDGLSLVPEMAAQAVEPISAVSDAA